MWSLIFRWCFQNIVQLSKISLIPICIVPVFFSCYAQNLRDSLISFPDSSGINTFIKIFCALYICVSACIITIHTDGDLIGYFLSAMEKNFASSNLNENSNPELLGYFSAYYTKYFELYDADTHNSFRNMTLKVWFSWYGASKLPTYLTFSVFSCIRRYFAVLVCFFVLLSLTPSL